jgi:hypothetical protein
MNLDPITNKIMADAMGDRSGLTPEQRAERERQDTIAEVMRRSKLTDFERQLILSAAMHSDGSVLLDALDGLLAQRFYLGREFQSERDSKLIGEVMARYVDVGDGVPLPHPLVSLGQGEYRKEIHE